MPITARQAHRAWITAEKIKRVSDRLLGLGPFSVGLDGLLAFVPVAGTLYSLGAGAWLLAEAVRIRASAWTLARMSFYVGFRTLVSIVPLEGWLVDFLFRGHMMAANALQKDIARRHGRPTPAAVAEARRRPFALRSGLARPLNAA
ncbi:MAG TPA: DUF4112 domain-containing protein [Caulobacteraceae bacterium]|nr:DUF4112 domain-containing protein [Caulobacteraceae bacterium]